MSIEVVKPFDCNNNNNTFPKKNRFRRVDNSIKLRLLPIKFNCGQPVNSNTINDEWLQITFRVIITIPYVFLAISIVGAQHCWVNNIQ